MYDWLYARGAPWEGGPREELVALVESARLTGDTALDVGCGSGANSLFLAEHGWRGTGVDFSPVALAKARAAAAERGLDVAFVEADLLGDVPLREQFDVVVDYGTLDDLRSRRRPELAARMTDWTRSGGRVLLWCFYRDIPWWRRRGARFPGGLRRGEEQALFGSAFEVERLATPAAGSGFACFLMTRR
jgi:cyclopropane fatty-acyl-phospholipid synthase-like methyltransferase